MNPFSKNLYKNILVAQKSNLMQQGATRILNHWKEGWIIVAVIEENNGRFQTHVEDIITHVHNPSP